MPTVCIKEYENIKRWASGKDEGLVGYWPFSEGIGTQAKDFSGFGNHGTLYGAPGPYWTKGKYNGALQFDSANDCVDVGDKSTLENMSQLSFGGWIYWNSSTLQIPFSKSLAYQLDIDNNADDKARAVIATVDKGWGVSTIYSDNAIPLFSWTYIMVTYDGATVRMYVNSVQQTATMAYTGAIVNSAKSFQIGAADSAIRYFFNGTNDEVRIYNRELSYQEVIFNYKYTPILAAPHRFKNQAEAIRYIGRSGLFK